MKSSSPSFKPLASRSLVLTKPDGFEMPIDVAIGAPYRPASMPAVQDQAGCLVLTCDDPDLATEIFGFDELEALAAAISFLQLYLIKITEETGGQLRTLSGLPVDPSGSIFLRQMREFVRRKEDNK